MTALHFACRNGRLPALVQVLLTYTVDLVVDTQGKTALDYARQAGHDDILEVLKAEKEFEEYFGHELPGALSVEGTVARSEIENAEDPNVTIAAQTSSGLVADDRVEQLKLEVLALKEQVRQRQIQFFYLSRAWMTLREQHKEMQNVF
jgi:ankyrin repeat protein